MKKIVIILIFLPCFVKGQYQVPEYVQNYDNSKPTVYAIDLGGGYQQVADSAAKANLSSDKRVVGMMVSYKDGGTWVSERYEGSDVLNVNWVNPANWKRISTSESLQLYVLRQELNDSLDNYVSLDSLGNYLTSTQTRQEISDSINSYNFPSFGADGQIPYMNSAGNDFVYGSNFTWDSTRLDFTYGVYNIFIGNGSGNASLTGADNNIFIGRESGSSNINGDDNICIGSLSGKLLTGSDNILIGSEAGDDMTSGSDNVCLGWRAGTAITTGVGNVLIGDVCGTSHTGSFNVAIGKNAAAASGGVKNVFLGEQAGQDNLNGNYNCFIGASSGIRSEGGYNVMGGFAAGSDNTGNSNVFIGHSAGKSSGSGSDNVFIGDSSGFFETGSDKLYIANSGTSFPLIKGDFSTEEIWLNTDTVHNKGHLVVDSTLYALHQIQVAVKDCVDITTTGVWLDVKLDTVFENVSTSGFSLNNDSTGIICNFDGAVKMNGKAVLTNNSPGSFNANVKLILYRNSTQIPTISSNVTRSWGSNSATTLIAPAFSFNVENGDTLYPKGKFGNANIDLDFPDEDISPKFPFILEFFQQPIKKK